MNRRTLLSAASATILAGCATSRAELNTLRPHALSPALDQTFAATMERVGIVPGMAVAAYTPEGVYASAFGVTDVDTGEPATADTAFYIASSTKSMTALAFSILAQRGELDLNATLGQFAPDAPLPPSVRPNDVRIRDLLTHTSGISNEPIGFRVAYSGEHDTQMLWRLLASSVPNAEAPLGQFMYVNAGYNIATVLSDRQLGLRWQDLLQRELFGPAGLTRTTASMSYARAAGWSIAKPHIFTAHNRVERTYLEKTDQTMHSAGGVIMSANDAARWLSLIAEDGRIAGRQIVPAAAVQATRAALVTSGEEFDGYQRTHYGLGWHIGPHRGARMLHQFGSFSGFWAHVSYMPDRRVGVAVFVNDNTIGAGIVNHVANYLYDRFAAAPDADAVFEQGVTEIVDRRAQVTPLLVRDQANRAARPWLLSRPMNAYAGRYENPDYGVLELIHAGDTLEARIGVLHALAAPFTRPDSLRLELEPGAGRSIQFEGEGSNPSSLIYEDARYVRL